MAKRKAKGMWGGEAVVMEFQEGGVEFRPEVGQAGSHSCIKINVRAWKSPGGLGKGGEFVLGLSFFQAEALVEILQNFVTSRRCNRKAQTPVDIQRDGSTRWSTFPYPV